MATATVVPGGLEFLIQRIKNSASCYSSDLNAMPEDALDQSPGGKARSAYDITYEVVELNRIVAGRARGEQTPFDGSEGWTRAPESYKNKAAVIADFEDSITQLVDALTGVNEETMSTPVETPFGALPLARLAEIVPRHIMYHSGQLNYIQTWLGDEVFHWN